MSNQRRQFVLRAVLALVGVWLLAAIGFFIAKNAKMTADKVQHYVASVDFGKLSAEDRARAIQKLADKINALSWDERQRLQIGRGALGWFDEMTEEEKGRFIDATMPTGFKQMLSAFEEMPQERRQRMIDESLRRLRDASSAIEEASPGRPAGPDGQYVFSEELQKKIRTIGLKTYYSESSAQTKAELAPMLEQLQKVMESGGRFRGRR